MSLERLVQSWFIVVLTYAAWVGLGGALHRGALVHEPASVSAEADVWGAPVRMGAPRVTVQASSQILFPIEHVVEAHGCQVSRFPGVLRSLSGGWRFP